MSSSEERIARMLDKEDIREALLHYTRGIDRHDVSIMTKAYHADATDDHGEYNGTAAGFIEYANRVHSDGFFAHQHYVGNHTIELDGDTARTETYFLASLRRDDGATMLCGGRYIDKFERRDGKWAIAHRTSMLEWAGDLVNSTFTSKFETDSRAKWDHTDLSYQRQ
jgi:ketosteroid isomerase-like protein